MKVSVIIPTKNEEKTIGKIIEKIKIYADEILVIDGHSRDRTKEIAEKLDVKVILDNNKGKGDAINIGLREAKYEVIVLIDGDGEHNPTEIPKFLEKIKDFDLVVGEREMYRSFGRGLVNKWNSFWVNLLIPGIDDVQCGFRAIRKEILKEIKLEGEGFEIELNLLLEAVKNNARIGKISITTVPTKKSQLKFKDYIKINNFFDKWILKNYKYLDKNFLSKFSLIIFSIIGLGIGKTLNIFFK